MKFIVIAIISMTTFAYAADTLLINCALDDTHQYQVVQSDEIELRFIKNGKVVDSEVLNPGTEYAEFEFGRYNRAEAYVFKKTNTDPSLIKTTREARLFGSRSTFLISYFDRNVNPLIGAIYIRNGRPMICSDVSIQKNNP